MALSQSKTSLCSKLLRIFAETFLDLRMARSTLCTDVLVRREPPALLLPQVFGNIELIEDSAINHHNNFQTFFQALTLLFRYAPRTSTCQL